MVSYTSKSLRCTEATLPIPFFKKGKITPNEEQASFWEYGFYWSIVDIFLGETKTKPKRSVSHLPSLAV